MGRMTLKQFREQTCTGIQRGTPTQVGVELVDTWIHNTMTEFGYAFKFRELEGYEEQPLLAGVDSIVHPADFRMVHEIGLVLLGVEGFEGKILPETRDQYIKRHRTVATNVVPGRPLYYHVFGPIFKVRPTPDVDYTVGVHFWARMQRLVDETEVSIFPDDWDSIILAGSKALGFNHFNEFDRYQNMRNDFLGMIRSRKFESDIEEFPEGGISAVNYKDTESGSVYGRTDESDSNLGEFR